MLYWSIVGEYDMKNGSRILLFKSKAALHTHKHRGPSILQLRNPWLGFKRNTILLVANARTWNELSASRPVRPESSFRKEFLWMEAVRISIRKLEAHFRIVYIFRTPAINVSAYNGHAIMHLRVAFASEWFFRNASTCPDVAFSSIRGPVFIVTHQRCN